MTLALIVSLTVRASVVLAAALVGARMLARSSAALRHAVIATSVCGALAVPLLAALLPEWQVTLPVRQLAVAPIGASTESAVHVTSRIELPTAVVRTPAESAMPVSPWWRRVVALELLWLAGAAFGLLALTTGLVRLWTLTRRAPRVTTGPWIDALNDMHPGGQRITVRQSGEPAVLLTWGVLRPCIVLPLGAQTWSRARIAIVLAHELEHIRRADWLTQLAAEVLKALAWFNPLAWMSANRLRAESERACDDAVLASGALPSDYAEQLLHIARSLTSSPLHVPAPAMARSSSLERRISAMLDSRVTRLPLTRPVLLTIAAGGLILSVSAATLAQSKFATVSGTVRDPLGGTIPKVTLTLTQADSGAKHEVKSTESGAFEFVGLPPGNYTFAAFTMGFQPIEASIQLAAGQTLQQDLRLEVGTLQETLMVRDGAPPLAPSRASASAAVPATCTAQPNSGGIKPPRKIADVRPIYPASLQGSGESGRVNLEAIIGVDGTVRSMRTIDATNVEFEQSAMDAVRRWRFTPTLLTCVPIEVTMKVAIAFSPEAAAPPPPPPALPAR